ncbi:MAG: hypothetical protein [Bacteriophage sp.]|nr:MAG: hypothetical protein [Bacteriophage sp.]
MTIDPKTFPLGGKNFVLTKFPATVGREIITQYPMTALPKIGEYKTNHQLMLKIMSYVGVSIEGRAEPQMLSTEDLINNHVLKTEDLMRLEWAMIEYNFDFFGDGRASNFLGLVADRITPLISKTLMDLLGPSSGKN